MIPLSLNPIQFSSSLKPPIVRPNPSLFKSSPDRKLGPYEVSSDFSNFDFRLLRRKIGVGICRAELSHDAPFVAAIGACMLSSLVLPVAGAPDDDEDGEDAAIDSTDARFGVMGIISFIPYFNWLSWVFAWLDTGKRRYAVYSLVYLLPYIRSNLSLSPEESWLPIASIVLCILHVQIEISIKNGDIQAFQFFSEASKRVSSASRRKDSLKGRKNEQINLSSADEQSRNKIRGSGVPREPLHDNEHLNDDWDEDDRRKH
ncbi:hypothetical protein L484_001699 [Morus notabilis]|uniref:Uncharacterized protein n=2 Tax=Morus notabilis TaxID=981085 RepID=W9QL22_9ROSA|nr:hypothetical protein L484_001699 [Morus notabilis]